MNVDCISSLDWLCVSRKAQRGLTTFDAVKHQLIMNSFPAQFKLQLIDDVNGNSAIKSIETRPNILKSTILAHFGESFPRIHRNNVSVGVARMRRDFGFLRAVTGYFFTLIEHCPRCLLVFFRLVARILIRIRN